MSQLEHQLPDDLLHDVRRLFEWREAPPTARFSKTFVSMAELEAWCDTVVDVIDFLAELREAEKNGLLNGAPDGEPVALLPAPTHTEVTHAWHARTEPTA